eukprot:TRINITY_DN3576_c0_g1_i1.p1 TRINITY_DN3576_c0_g1~~TRINITY_DN3576_c0_g1_i1.p1  ORF type:complete len:191 (+),score=23.85 TRINITY_DN3576_c0_g1_i1:250-822(+)
MFVTIATIGYGDITAKTYCGRTVVIIGSVWGVVTTALLIGIVDQALKLSYSQMRVVNLLASDKWRSELRESAATVVQRIWRLRKMKHKPWHKKQRAITALYSWRKLRRKYQIFLDRCDNGSQSDPILETIHSETQILSDHVLNMNERIDQIENLLRNLATKSAEYASRRDSQAVLKQAALPSPITIESGN